MGVILFKLIFYLNYFESDKGPDNFGKPNENSSSGFGTRGGRGGSRGRGTDGENSGFGTRGGGFGSRGGGRGDRIG